MCSEISALMPTLKPIAIALMRFCTGYTSESAVMASSLMRATKRLSTMLYSALTSMEMTMGSAIEVSNGKIGFSFIKVSFMGFSFSARKKRHTTARRAIVWRKVVSEL